MYCTLIIEWVNSLVKEEKALWVLRGLPSCFFFVITHTTMCNTVYKTKKKDEFIYNTWAANEAWLVQESDMSEFKCRISFEKLC